MLIPGAFVVGVIIGVAVIVLTSGGGSEHVVTVKRAELTTSTSDPPTTTTSDAKHTTTRRRTTTTTSTTRAPDSSGPQPTVGPGAAASFQRLASGLPGGVGIGVAALGDGPVQTFGSAQVAHAWSTSKVPVLTALMVAYAAKGRMLSPPGRDLARLAITESDNAAINELFGKLEQLKGGLNAASQAIQQLFRTAGDTTATVNTAPNDQGFSTEGQSLWSLRDELFFYRALARGCLLGSSDAHYVLGLMSMVVPGERWGAGSAGFPGSAYLGFKGGWGPNSGGRYEVRQTAIVTSHGRGYVMTMLALPSDGSFGTGTTMLTSLASWGRRHFHLDAQRPPASCAD